MKSFVFCYLIFLGNCCLGQNNESYYQYDQSGNRISREIIIDFSGISRQTSYEQNGFVFSVYPNIVETTLNVELDHKYEIKPTLSIEVLDMNGKLLLKKANITQNETLSFSHFSPGVYMVFLKEHGNKVAEWKVLKN